MLGSHAAFSLVSFIFSWLGNHVDREPACRCLFGDSCWPSTKAFSELESHLSAPLIYPHPLAQPCYTSGSSACSTIHTNWEDGQWRAKHPGAAQHPNFETFITPNGEMDACYLNTSLGVSCGQGSVSVIGVEARTIEDIQTAVKFAARRNLKLVVKNTGHDFLGRSSGRGSFVLWTHHMKSIKIHESFPSENTQVSAITVGAGVQWQEAYEASDAAGMMIVGGISPGGSVGAAGGWLLGGGHSALSPTYGLGVDNVLGISLVTSAGDHLTTNAHRHPDLFWALRGGGGGTFGIVTSVTYRTYPIVPVVTAILSVSVNGPQPNGAFRKTFTELVRISSSLTDAGWGGYTQFSPAPDSLSLGFIAIIPNVSWEHANRTIQPYFGFVQALPSTESFTTNGTGDVFTINAAFTRPYPSFWTLYKELMPRTGQVGSNVELGLWLLSRQALDKDYLRVADTLLTIPGLSYELVAGGRVSKVDPSSTGLNPAWRDAGAHAVFGAVWPEGASFKTITDLRDEAKDKMTRLRALSPESGAYFNEASMFEPDPRRAFFGVHYNRLRAIKNLYDPIDLFVVTEGVGADKWDRELKCRL